MKKILIIGDDVHSERYICSLLFLDKYELFTFYDNEYNLKVYNNKKENINDFSYIIYTKPLYFDEKILHLLNNYTGILLIEKLQLQLDLFTDLKCKYYFVHLREFDLFQNKIKFKSENLIKWPNLKYESMDEIYNTLPNILDVLLFNGITINDNISLEILSNTNEAKKISVCLLNENLKFNIEIINTKNKSLHPIINGIEIEWPNYFLCIIELIKRLEKQRLDYQMSLNREKKYNKIIKILEERIWNY